MTDDPDATAGSQICSLCNLPTLNPPVTGDDVTGAYCCRGCLAVARSLGGPDAAGWES